MRNTMLIALILMGCGDGRPGPWSATEKDPVGSPALRQARHMSAAKPQINHELEQAKLDLKLCEGRREAERPPNVWEKIGKNPKVAMEIYQLAIANGRRIDLGIAFYGPYLKGASSIKEEGERLALLIKGDSGSYTDFILPYISTLIERYEPVILGENSDLRRADYAKDLLAVLHDILRALDEQIKMFKDEQIKRMGQQMAYDQIAAMLPPSAEYSVARHIAHEIYPHYGLPIRGFFSHQVEVQKDNRSYDNYHHSERKALTKAIGLIGPTLSVEDYRKIATGIDSQDSRIGHFFLQERK